MSSKIACIVLTKNEEKNIAICLSHLQWADELIIVDSGSTDRTLEIAKEFGAKVFSHAMNPFIIAEQRNWAINNCVGDSEWVLFVDADEVITDKLKDEIIKKINDSKNNKVAFRLCFKFMFMGKWIKYVTQFPSWHDRLSKRGEVKFAGGVWEYFDCSEDRVGYIKEPYLHFGFNNGLAAWIDRHNRYSTDVAQRIFEYRKQRIKWKVFLRYTANNRDKKREMEKIASRFPFLLPFATFVYLFFIKKGFLDGFAGMVYSLMLSVNNFFVWLKILELEHRKKNKPL